MDTSKRNRNAGKHPSYNKRNMSPEQIAAKRKYDGNYEKSRVSDRVSRNKARRDLGLKPGDKRDASHTKNGIVAKHRSKNRGSKTDMPGDRRARGGKLLVAATK